MRPIIHEGIQGTRHATRDLLIATVETGSEIGRLASSVATSLLAVGLGHLLGNSACRGLGDRPWDPRSWKAAPPGNPAETPHADAHRTRKAA